VRADPRGQALTLEAVAAGLLLLTAVGFALQMTAVTPLSASTSSQHLENQLQEETAGVLAAAAEEDGLANATLYWNESTEQFHNAEFEGVYTTKAPNITFGEELERTFGNRSIAFNVVFYYQNRTGNGIQRERQRFIDQGQPSDNAVSYSRTVVLTNDDKLVNPDGSRGPRIDNSAANFYMPDAAVNSQTFYNLVRVEVIVWRV